MKNRIVCTIIILAGQISQLSWAQTKAQAKAAQVRAPASAPAKAEPSMATKLSHLGEGNRSFEIRGQARSLSMMLVLKNSKDDINFIKVRKNYNPEIRTTEF